MSNLSRGLKKKLLFSAALLIISLVMLPAYVGAYILSGISAAPTLLLGDRVLVNRGAYDIRIPYSDRVLVNRNGPAPGDLVLVESPDNGQFIFKRVAAIPGDRVAMHEHHLIINGRPLTYTAVGRTAFAAVPRENRIGSVIEIERLGSHDHLITYTPDSTASSFPEVIVPADHYFLIGDNRDQSRDSRAWGPVPRKNFRGRVFLQPHRG
jgi:signal peptidase I